MTTGIARWLAFRCHSSARAEARCCEACFLIGLLLNCTGALVGVLAFARRMPICSLRLLGIRLRSRYAVLGASLHLDPRRVNEAGS
jgi:hypothetical protein